MPKFAFAVPVLPGRDAREVTSLVRDRKDEYEESRRRAGITMERVYEQVTPMGTFVVAYIESEHDMEATLASQASSGLAFDRDFNAKVAEVHGFDSSQPLPGPGPEVIADWADSAVPERRTGLAFLTPLAPGRADAARAFGAEAFVARREAFTASRRALGQNAETVILLTSPQGDLVIGYLEGADPVEGNRRFAASQSEYDRWFKDQLRSIFPAEIDFDQPLPPIEQLWDWQRARVSA
jgi:hypothetical protein